MSGIEVEVLGHERVAGTLSTPAIEQLCERTAAALGVADGHLAIEFVGEDRIAELNGAYRQKATPTDVLSFPIDGADDLDGVERELGDIVICPPQTEDLRAAIVHGVLHLLGMDHETDDGEMLSLQASVLRSAATLPCKAASTSTPPGPPGPVALPRAPGAR